MRFGDDQDRLRAVRELADKPKRVAVGSLLHALVDSEAHVRSAAISALAKFQASEALPGCQRLATGDADATVRATAIGLLGRVPDPGNVPALRAALRDAVPGVRAAAAKALSRQNGVELAHGLTDFLSDESELVREAAIASLGKLKCTAAVPRLVELLDEEDEVPQSRIQEALIAITGRNFGLDADDWREGLTQRRKDAETD